MSIGFSDKDLSLLRKLNRRSWTHTFSPDCDVDWQSSTTQDEFRALYDAWSLLQGTRHENSLDDEQRIRFAKYQQMNLMLGTALFERCALANLESLYDDDPHPDYQEYVSHLIKEETYHYMLFTRAIARMMESDPTLQPLPSRAIRVYMSVVLFLLRCVPSRRLRHSMFFFLLHFVEDITLKANTMTRRIISRNDSLVVKVWELHAIDESRHVAFDHLMMRKAHGPGVLGKIPLWLTIPLCVGASLLINLNEIWAARKLGVRVGYHELPMLMKRTTAPFKRKVFSSLFGASANNERTAT
jgi:hypothetical protein